MFAKQNDTASLGRIVLFSRLRLTRSGDLQKRKAGPDRYGNNPQEGIRPSYPARWNVAFMENKVGRTG